MRTDQAGSSATTATAQTRDEHSKLISLLALAAGAAAMPQTSQADIIFTDQNATVSWEGTSSFVINNLPGNAQFGFQAFRAGYPYLSSIRYITGGRRGSGYLKFKSAWVPQSWRWSEIPAGLLSGARLASASSSGNSGGFNGLYLAFEFKDSSQAGSPMRYGWVGVSVANGDLTGFNDRPILTISGWAYDNAGAQIPMGAQGPVPEPSAMTLLALGALTLGAKGLRSWRRNRAAASQS